MERLQWRKKEKDNLNHAKGVSILSTLAMTDDRCIKLISHHRNSTSITVSRRWEAGVGKHEMTGSQLGNKGS